MKKLNHSRIDWLITLVPFFIIILLASVLFAFPEYSNIFIGKMRYFFGDKMSVYYLGMGLLIFIISIFLAFSKYGNIVLGEAKEKPQYPFFVWGSMMFTCGLAADILFYSFGEWVTYATNDHIQEMGNVFEWAGVFPLFHWSFIPWAFYLVLAVVFGFMLHVRKRKRQRYSEACRSILGRQTDGILGRIIDLFGLFALLAGTATTFSVATPLMSAMIVNLLGVNIPRNTVTIIILMITCCIYTYAVLHGFKGISLLAKICIFLFFGLLVIVLLLGGQGAFIIENGFQSMGKMIQNFIELSTYTDPGRGNHFPQEWTVYYWAYWMVWCVAAPFFIGNISRGRTIKQTILGGYIFGVGSTITSFIVLGNYSLGLQTFEKFNFIEAYLKDGDMYSLILKIVDTMPFSKVILVIIILCMITFYATSFDSIAYTAACYSYKSLGEDEHPHRIISFLWCILLIVLPIALVFSESSMANIQSISIISAFPIGIIMILIIFSFFKDIKAYMKEH